MNLITTLLITSLVFSLLGNALQLYDRYQMNQWLDRYRARLRRQQHALDAAQPTPYEQAVAEVEAHHAKVREC